MGQPLIIPNEPTAPAAHSHSHAQGWLSPLEIPSAQCGSVVTPPKAPSTALSSVAALWQPAGTLTPLPLVSQVRAMLQRYPRGSCAHTTAPPSSATQHSSWTQPQVLTPPSRYCWFTAPSLLGGRYSPGGINISWCLGGHFRNIRTGNAPSPLPRAGSLV